jgi:hypothetical protein
VFTEIAKVFAEIAKEHAEIIKGHAEIAKEHAEITNMPTEIVRCVIQLESVHSRGVLFLGLLGKIILIFIVHFTFLVT